MPGHIPILQLLEGPPHSVLIVVYDTAVGGVMPAGVTMRLVPDLCVETGHMIYGLARSSL